VEDCASGGPSTTLPCDDNDPNTINDVVTTLDCDGTVCVPCMGTPVDCSSGATNVVPCDDGNPCTSGETETVLVANGLVCIPCGGGLVEDCASGGPSTTLPCDDNDPNTINDMVTTLDCDGTVCIPCSGTPVDCTSGPATEMPCDDGNVCTSGDVQTILDADGTICIPCAGVEEDCATGTTSVVGCDDGIASTINDQQTILDCDGSVCVPCMGTAVDCSSPSITVSVVGCDDGDPCTSGDVQTLLDLDGSICLPCAGVAEVCDTGAARIVACNDGDDTTVNDEQTILECDGSVCVPCMGTLCDAEASLGPDRTIAIGDSIELEVFTNLAIDSVDWGMSRGLSCTNCLNPVAKPAETTSYTVRLIDEQGCEASTRITITVDPKRKTYAPSAFSPNGDGVNDRFGIRARIGTMRVSTLAIYNRWGAELFRGGDTEFGGLNHEWDGTNRGEVAEVGVYIYVAELVFLDGQTEKVYGEVLITR
jgi:gliding motility-associated-like protein